jgi:hypothetical protein
VRQLDPGARQPRVEFNSTGEQANGFFYASLRDVLKFLGAEQVKLVGGQIVGTLAPGGFAAGSLN